MNTVTILEEDLRILTAAAKRYAEDLSTGLEDGTYEEGEEILAELEPVIEKYDVCEEPVFVNYYKCPRCATAWQDTWSAMCDDDCPTCGNRHISPHYSEQTA